MKTVSITRLSKEDSGIFGNLTINGLVLITGEEPAPFTIPPGIYHARPFWSEHFQGLRYMFTDVPEHDRLFFHAANFMGDASKGFDDELKGCVALGTNRSRMTNSKGNLQDCLLNSSIAVNKFLKETDGEEIEITIV